MRCLLMALALLLPPCGAQQPAESRPTVTVTTDMLIGLHAAGVDAASILKVLDEHGLPALDATGLAALRRAGLPEEVMERIQRRPARAAGKDLDVDDVVNMVKAGLEEAAVIRAIRASSSRFDLDTQAVIDLVVTKGLPSAVVKAMRESGRSTTPAPAAKPVVTIEDVIRYTEAGMKPQWIIERIRAGDSRFQARPDELIDLSRKGVTADVLGEIWKRSSQPEQAPKTQWDSQAEATSRPVSPRQQRYVSHVDEGLGFSLLVPAGWVAHRDRKGPNDLMSFSNRALKAEGGFADEELQVARFRASQPERLTDTNLLPIARNFVGSLKTNFARRGVSMTTGRARRTHLSGRPALAFPVTTSMDDGPTLQGEVTVTWEKPYVYMLSYAVRAEQFETRRADLERSLHSFTIERAAERPALEGDDAARARHLFKAWKVAVTSRDFPAFRSLHAEGFGSQDERLAFIALCDRMTQPDRHLSFAEAQADGGDVIVSYRMIDAHLTTTGRLRFRNEKGALVLAEDS